MPSSAIEERLDHRKSRSSMLSLGIADASGRPKTEGGTRLLGVG
jgi:hypothetical protein